MALKNHCDACDSVVEAGEIYIPSCFLPSVQYAYDKYPVTSPARFPNLIISFRSSKDDLSSKKLTICITCLRRLCETKSMTFKYFDKKTLGEIE